MRPSGYFIRPHLALGAIWVWDPNWVKQKLSRHERTQPQHPSYKRERLHGTLKNKHIHLKTIMFRTYLYEIGVPSTSVWRTWSTRGSFPSKGLSGSITRTETVSTRGVGTKGSGGSVWNAPWPSGVGGGGVVGLITLPNAMKTCCKCLNTLHLQFQNTWQQK